MKQPIKENLQLIGIVTAVTVVAVGIVAVVLYTAMLYAGAI